MNKNFEIFYNALSVGWHLRRIAEIDKNILYRDKKSFDKWLKRHFNIKNEKTDSSK